jgi:hypothetical protein
MSGRSECPAAATSPPKHTTLARPNAATAGSPTRLVTTMNELTATSRNAPVDGATRATSVTWTHDQSTAVPSAQTEAERQRPEQQCERWHPWTGS